MSFLPNPTLPKTCNFVQIDLEWLPKFSTYILRCLKEVSSFPYSFITANLSGVNSPGGCYMIVNISKAILMFVDPLTFVLHPIATFGMVRPHGSFITFLFVHLSAFACGIVPR